MVEETPQINPVDPDPGPITSANGTGSPWQTNGVVSKPSFTPAESGPGDAADETEKDAVAAEPDAVPEATAGEADATDAAAADSAAPGGADDGAIFLASLARAMQDAATADRTRVATDTDQRRDAHIAGINARRESEQARMHELADDDRKAIDDWVAAEQQRIQEEKERRTAALEADLKTSIGEHGAKIDREIERVEAAIVVYRADVDAYFGRLEGDSDPLVIAQHAARRPAFPDLEKIGHSIEPGEDAKAASSDNGPGATDDGAAPKDQAGTEATAAVAVAVADHASADAADAADAAEAVGAVGEASAEADPAVATDSTEPADATEVAGAPEAPVAATTEPVAISAAKSVGVMETAKPPTKLAQAWAAWNESTKAADAAAADKSAKKPAEFESFTLTPPATTSAKPAPGPGDKTTASSAAMDPPADAGSVAVAAGTWKPPVPGTQQSLAGGAMSWLRRDRDRDHGGH
jgi:hypothetical protein